MNRSIPTISHTELTPPPLGCCPEVKTPKSQVMISAPECVVIAPINKHQLLCFSASLEHNFTLRLFIHFILSPSASLSLANHQSLLGLGVGGAVPKDPKFYCVFASSAQTIGFSHLAIKTSATVLIIAVCCKSTLFILKQRQRLT